MAKDQKTPNTPAVVVGTDGTDTALRAVSWAAAEARVRAAALRIVHAAPYAASRDEACRHRAAAILARAYTVAHQYEPHVAVHTHQTSQQPVPALLHAAENADLLVVGMRGERLGEVLIGSVALAVSGAARCPVTVVRGQLGSSLAAGITLLGLEDVANDAPAVTVAFADAQRHRARLIVLHARADSLRQRIGRDVPAPVERVLVHQLAPWRSRYPKVPVDLRVVHGAPADELLRAARTARLVVVGTHGYGAPARMVLGSTSRTLVRYSSCPVTVVRWDTVIDEKLPQPATSPAGCGP
jgi:nucleotide-binding universal stress UspA family protein